MFEVQANTSGIGSAVSLAERIYHGTVRQLRKSHGNALIGLIVNIFQSMLFVLAFYAMFEILGMRGSAVRGDFMLYVMSGIFLFLTHTKAMGAVVGAENAAAPMMQHGPMNTVISISSAAIGSLYIQILSAAVILILYYAIVTPFEIVNPFGAVAMFLLAWFSGIAVGMVFYSVKPWFPGFVGIASTVYARANMIASGKMFLANSLPPTMLAMFDWNPLFHCIDQERGFIFINYNPHNSSISYPIYVTLVLVMIGLLGEFYTRKHISKSWSAKR